MQVITDPIASNFLQLQGAYEFYNNLLDNLILKFWLK